MREEHFGKAKSEKRGACQSLAPEFKSRIDQEKIANGMTLDAVYFAWGEPSEVLSAEDSGGAIAKWLYYQTSQHLVVRPGMRSSLRKPSSLPEGPVLESRIEKVYHPQHYVRAEADFQNGVVKARRIPPPPHSVVSAQNINHAFPQAPLQFGRRCLSGWSRPSFFLRRDGSHKPPSANLGPLPRRAMHSISGSEKCS